MSVESRSTYTDGDIVWVKFGPFWWPSQVNGLDKLPEILKSECLRKPPLAVVKFFHEDSFEFIKNSQQICEYTCAQKEALIKKSLDKLKVQGNRSSDYKKKFFKDIRIAEVMTDGDPDILSRQPFKNDTSRTSDSQRDTRGQGMDLMDEPRHLVENDLCRMNPTTNKYNIRIREQPVSTPSARTNGGSYPCYICGFSTSRVNVIIYHLKFHRLHEENLRSITADTDRLKSELEHSETRKRKYNKKNIENDRRIFRTNERSSPRKIETCHKRARSDKELKETLLADWNVDSDDDESMGSSDPDRIKSTHEMNAEQKNSQIGYEHQNDQRARKNDDSAILLQESEKFLREVDEFTRDSNFLEKQFIEGRPSSSPPDSRLSSCPASRTQLKAKSYLGIRADDDKRTRSSCFDFAEDDNLQDSPAPLLIRDDDETDFLMNNQKVRKDLGLIRIVEKDSNNLEIHATVAGRTCSTIPPLEEECRSCDGGHHDLLILDQRIEDIVPHPSNPIRYEKTIHLSETGRIEASEGSSEPCKSSCMKSRNHHISIKSRKQGTAREKTPVCLNTSREKETVVSNLGIDGPEEIEDSEEGNGSENAEAKVVNVLTFDESCNNRQPSNRGIINKRVNRCTSVGLQGTSIPILVKSICGVTNDSASVPYPAEIEKVPSLHEKSISTVKDHHIASARIDSGNPNSPIIGCDDDTNRNTGYRANYDDTDVESKISRPIVTAGKVRSSVLASDSSRSTSSGGLIDIGQKHERFLDRQIDHDAISDLGYSNAHGGICSGKLDDENGINPEDSGHRTNASDDHSKGSYDAPKIRENLEQMIGHGAQNENATCEPQESAHLQSRDFQDELGSFPAEKSAERENCFRKRSETKPHPPSDCEMDQIDLHKDMNLEIATRKPHVDQSWNSGEEVDKAQLLSKAMIDEIENSVSDSVNFHSSPGVNTKMFIENPSGVDRNRAVLCKVDIDPKSTSQRLWEVERSKSDDLVGIESTTSCSNSMKKREKPRIIGNVTLREPLIVKTTSTKSHARLVKPLRKSLGRRYSDPKKITSSRSNDHSTQVHGRIVSSVNFNQMSPTNLGIPLNPIVDVESTHSESPLASNTNLEDSRNFDNQNSLNLIASDLDIASLPFVLSEDLLDSKNMEKLSLGCSNEFKKTEGAQEISSHYPEIINPHQFSDEVLGIATVDQRKYETRNTAKNESKGFEPAEIRIKTILSEVPNELRHTHKADPCSIEVSLTDRSTSGKCVIVQTSGRQKRLKTHRAVVLATPKESENAQIVHQGGKVVILSPPKPDQHEKESFHVDLPLEIRTKTLEESIEDGIFHESECSLPKADDDMSSSKEDLCRAVLNSVKSDQQEVRSHRATTLSNEEISAGNDSSSSLSLPEKQLLDDPSIIHRVEHLKCPVESAGRSNMTEANAKCRRIVSKGTILTPITGSQVKLLVAKSMRRTTARKLENESKFGRDTTAPIPFPSFPDSNTPTGVLHPPKMIVHASSSGRESRFQGASSKSYTLTSASSSFSSDEITRACLKSMDSIHCPTSVMPKLGNIQHSSGRELPAKDNKYESKEGSKPKSQSSISATKYLVTPKEPVTESEHPCSSIASRCSTRVDVDSNLRRRATTSSSAGFESDRTELPCKKLLSDIPGGFEVGHLEHKSPPVTDKIHCTDSSEQIEIATLPAESDDSAQSHIFVTVGNQTDAVLRIGDSTISPIDIDDTDDPSHLLRTNISDHCVIPEGASGAAGELSSINQVPVTWESIRAIQKVDSIQSENLSSENRDICPTALVYSNLEHRVQMSDTNTAAATNDQQPESLIKPTFFLSVSGMPTPPNEPIATSFKVTNDALTDCDNSGSMTTSDGTTSHLSSGTSVENQSLHSSTNVVSKIEDSHVSTNPSMCGAIDGSSTRVHQDQDVERIAQTPNPLVQQINPELRASLTKCRVKSIQSIERLTPMAHPTITGIGPKHAETNAESVQTHANRSASQAHSSLMGTSITRSSDDRLIEIPQIDVESVPCQVDVSIAGESVKNEHIEQDGIHFLLDCTGEEECASQMLTIFQPHCSDNPSHALIQVTTNSSSDVDTESCDKSKGMKFIESGGPGDSQSDQRRSELIQHVRVAEGIEMVVLDSISASESDASNHISSALGFRHTSTSLSGPSSAKEMITIQSTQKDPSALCSNPGFAVVDDTICPLYIPGTPEAQERDQDQESAISTSSYEIPPCEDLNIESSAIVPHELVIPNDGKEDRTGTEISSHASSSLFASLEGKTRSPLIPMDHDDTDADGSGMFTRDHLRTDDDSQS